MHKIYLLGRRSKRKQTRSSFVRAGENEAKKAKKNFEERREGVAVDVCEVV